MKFNGYERRDGRVGCRNHVLVFPTVVCASTVAQKISELVPGTVSVSHPHGCGHLGADREHMTRTMVGYCRNPNVGAVLLVGLGCELIGCEELADALIQSGQRVERLSIQQEGGTTAAIAKGRDLAAGLVTLAGRDARRRSDISNLVVGVKCGGSDTFSGLTANPAVGAAADLLVDRGSSVLMSEIPEMIGAEHVLRTRAATASIAAALDAAVRRTDLAILAAGVDVRGTEPSPGNIQGGLTTLEEKSLGAIRKGGTSPIVEIVDYGQTPSKKGLVVMDGPALDAVCVTGMLAAGAQLILFTTGRGTPLGAAVAPVIKIASNSAVYESMKENLDINAGEIIDRSTSIAKMGRAIFDQIIQVADGKQTRSEVLGHCEFAIHSLGPAV